MTSEGASSSLTITNIGAIVTGDLEQPLDLHNNQVVIRNGWIERVGQAASIDHEMPVLDVDGMTVIPALVDSHVHPVVGGMNPRLGLYDFLTYYGRAGVSTCVSAGVLHFPDFHGQDA